MIKEYDNLCAQNQDESHSNETQVYQSTSDYENLIVQFQQQIDTLNINLIDNSMKIVELKQIIKKYESQEKDSDSKIKQLNQKIEQLTKAQKEKRNRHIKEIYNLKKTVYIILQQFVSYQIYQEDDNNFYDFESNIENILTKLIKNDISQVQNIQIKQDILFTENKMISNNNQQFIENNELLNNQIDHLHKSIHNYVLQTIELIQDQLKIQPSFIKNNEDNKIYNTELQKIVQELKNGQIEQTLNKLLSIQKQLNQEKR